MSDVPKKNLEVKRIFIASPGDLNEERQLFPEILEKVNRIKAKSMGMLLEPVGWEDTLPGSGRRPQEMINEDLKTCDLIVMLLWKRWGSETGKYSSGFEEEYELACSEEKEIWLYFRSIPDDMLADAGPQLKKVLKFRDKIEKDKKIFYKRYEDEHGWKELLMDNLCSWLDDLPLETFEMEKLGEYKTKIEELEKELSKKENEQVEIAYDLSKEARVLADSGQITQAEEHFARALAIVQEPYILNSYALFLMRIGTLKKAERIFKQLSSIGKVMGNKKVQAIAYGNLGVLYKTKGDLKKAEKMCNKSLKLNREMGSKEGLASLYGNLGILNKIRGDIIKAETMFNKSLNLNQEMGSKEGLARDYGNLGSVYLTRGDLEKAEEMYKKSLAIHEELGNKEGLANDYGNLGIFYKIRGELKKAEEMYKKSLAIHGELGNKEGLAKDYCNLGILYNNRGELKKAEKIFNKSIKIDEELGNKEGLASDYCNLGILYKNKGNFKEAEKMLNKSLAINQDLGRKEGMAINYGNLGVLYLKKGDLEAAEKMFIKSLALNQELGSKEVMASDYANMGIVYYTKGDLQKAKLMYKKSLNIFTSFGNKAMIEKLKSWLEALENLKKDKKK